MYCRLTKPVLNRFFFQAVVLTSVRKCMALSSVEHFLSNVASFLIYSTLNALVLVFRNVVHSFSLLTVWKIKTWCLTRSLPYQQKKGNIAVNISCTVLIQKNTHFTAPLVSLVDSARTGQTSSFMEWALAAARTASFVPLGLANRADHTEKSDSSCSIPQNGPQVQQLTLFLLVWQ